ncbi:MAG: hypothetical protein JWN56_2697 [Sphingobacteriales bacterium]|nr:hypothetical protein [Sphingobacteriales bacterium]
MKKLIFLFLIVFIGTNAHASFISKPNEAEISKLLDGFSTAIVKKDKIWLNTNLSADCLMEITGSGTFDKEKIIHVFTQGVYNVSKSVFMNKKFSESGVVATANAAMEVEGTMAMEGKEEDISSVYIFDIKFKKSATGWLISGIQIKEDK